MTLALLIALIILGAVYEFLNRQITLAEVGRELVEEGDLARTILTRMSADIKAHLGAIDPAQLPDSANTVAGASGSTGGTDGSTTDPTAAAIQSEFFQPNFNLGVEGTDTVLMLTSSRVARELLASDKRLLDPNSLPKVSDLRRVSYWFSEDGTNPGLARQELTNVTGEDILNQPPDVPNASECIIAPEVKTVLFEYFDGQNWQPTWSGSQMAADGQTPLGPPSAIRITLTVKSRDGLRTRDYKHTVALPTGNNFLSQQLGF